MIIRWSAIQQTECIPPFGDELFKHLNLYRGTVKYASCSAWVLLYNTLLSNGLAVSNVSFNSSGKPFFISSSLHFSISHSNELCAVAIANSCVGVDIEICKVNYNKHLLRRVINESEQFEYNGDFTRLWCRKEAVAKMTGEGIIRYPSQINTTRYVFREELIEYKDQKYWLVAVNEK